MSPYRLRGRVRGVRRPLIQRLPVDLLDAPCSTAQRWRVQRRRANPSLRSQLFNGSTSLITHMLFQDQEGNMRKWSKCQCQTSSSKSRNGGHYTFWSKIVVKLRPRRTNTVSFLVKCSSEEENWTTHNGPLVNRELYPARDPCLRRKGWYNRMSCVAVIDACPADDEHNPAIQPILQAFDPLRVRLSSWNLHAGKNSKCTGNFDTCPNPRTLNTPPSSQRRACSANDAPVAGTDTEIVRNARTTTSVSISLSKY